MGVSIRKTTSETEECKGTKVDPNTREINFLGEIMNKNHVN